MSDATPDRRQGRAPAPPRPASAQPSPGPSSADAPSPSPSPTQTLAPGQAPPSQGNRRTQLSLLLGDRKRSVFALAGFSFFSGLTEAATIAVIAQIAYALVKSGDHHVRVTIAHISVTTTTGALIEIAFVLSLARLVLQIPLSILPARIAADVQSKLRIELFDAYSRAAWGVQAQDREGQLQETITSQVTQATQGALQATTLITSLTMFGLLRPLRGRGVRSARALSKAQVAFAGAIAEAIRVAQETHVFGVTSVQGKRIERFVRAANHLYFRTQLLVKMVGNLYQSLIYILLVAGIWGLYLIGGHHAASVGGVILLLLRAGISGQMVQLNYQGLAQALPFIERASGNISRYAENTPPDGGASLGRVETVAFDDVSFSYVPGRPVLSDVTFEVDAGEVIGVIGPSGAGKSTLVQLLLRLRSPESGVYLINGRSADDFSREDWHRQVSFVPQEPRLIHATVSENISFYRDIPQEEVERAAKLARIHDDIVGWAKGYDTIVGPRADAVSGGQQQRICLARALAARPDVLVLDEPTSALDPSSEALITESLKALRSELTLFIIAHRMSTLDICDRVMVVVDGRLAAFDTKALLQQNNTYYRHASSLALGSSVGAR
jgi:ATP-binding cassette, subfamily B, bacterial